MHRPYQRTENQLKRQQEILKVLGFYKGALTGKWDEHSIQAMKLFESDIRFRPGIPNHGLPLGDRPYPASIHIDPKDKCLLTCTELEMAVAAAAKAAAEEAAAKKAAEIAKQTAPVAVKDPATQT
jgi:hypothetical protein